MKVRYKQHGEDMLYDPICLPVVPRQPPLALTGPFERCRGCPYPGHGFICWGCDGETCLRTEVHRIMRHGRGAL